MEPAQGDPLGFTAPSTAGRGAGEEGRGGPGGRRGPSLHPAAHLEGGGRVGQRQAAAGERKLAAFGMKLMNAKNVQRSIWFFFFFNLLHYQQLGCCRGGCSPAWRSPPPRGPATLGTVSSVCDDLLQAARQSPGLPGIPGTHSSAAQNGSSSPRLLI